VIQVDNISKKFGKNVIFKKISFEIKENEKLLIIGPSGCGKTTLIRCLNGLEKTNEGNILLNGVNIKDIDDSSLKSKIGMVFQNFNLFPHLSVKENVSLAPSLLKIGTKEEINKRVKSLLNKVHILNKSNEYPKTLSGGERQRVAIARALATNPEVILFDEPTSSLDPEVAKDFLDLVNELAATTTIVIVSHEMSLITSYADKVLFLSDGDILEYGSPEDILNSKNEKVKTFLSDFR
jgi:polar amino acid transport system ATP-binding protein